MLREVKELVDGERGSAEKLEAVCKLLREAVSYYDWVGLYLRKEGERELILGPYSGEPTEHAKIEFGQGICGQAAERGETFIVGDVSQESNYLACSPEVEAEIVVPLFKGGDFVGELDIDSNRLDPFSEKDRDFLNRVGDAVAELI